MEEFLKKYNTSEEGLSSSEVTKRQNQNGLNELKEKKKCGYALFRTVH